MARMARIPRSRGAVSGVLLILLGAWGGLVPFIGPYFGYAYTPDTASHCTQAGLWLEILPGAAAVFGGMLVAVSARRLRAGGGAILAALGGVWFVAGRAANMVWPHLGVPGAPAGTSVRRVLLEEFGFFTGLGVVIVFFAALALGGCAVVGVKDAALAERASEAAQDDDYGTATVPGTASPYAGLSAEAPSGQGDPFPPQEETYQPGGGPYAGPHDESPTATGRLPAAERNIFTPAEPEKHSPEPESFRPATGQFPTSPSGGTAP